MKLTAKIVAKQRKEIQKFLHDRDAKAVAAIKQKYPQLTKAMAKEWDMSNSDFLDPEFYDDVEERIPEDTR